MGVVVPLGEVVGIRDLPATVTGLPSPVGSEALDNPVAVLSPAGYVVRAQVEPARAELLTPGTSGVAEIDGVTQTWDVEVVAPDGAPTDGAPTDGGAPEGSTTGAGAGQEPSTSSAFAEDAIVFMPTVPFSQDMIGSSVRIEVTLDSTEQPVLAAPIAAVRTNSDGEYLEVADDDGEPERVPITPGRSIGGWVELVNPGDLEAGLTVLLGR